ncbi:MAG: carboxypeptidase regulatory-like domain-containing protein [Acidimicrobiia bacterium]|nr:carboxypeptidase regulatory-like domain-containing protein [Acidimicrobiia bacterium]
MKRPAAIVLLAVLASGLLGACSKKGGYNFPPPPKVDANQSTTVPDYSSVELARVSGRTTTTINNAPGQAHISGFVVAPQLATSPPTSVTGPPQTAAPAAQPGAVPGATVHVERLVGDATVVLDVATNPDGSFHIDNVQGGRYRIRAWRTPDLALTTPVVFFLNGTENKTGVNLQLTQYTGTNVAPAIAPSPPIVGDPVNLAVQVTSVVVDPTGVVRATPLVGAQVDLQGSGAWQLQSPTTQFTDNSGEVIWRLTCTSTGTQPLSVSVNGFGYPLNLPPCQESAFTSPGSSPPTSFVRNTTTTRF